MYDYLYRHILSRVDAEAAHRMSYFAARELLRTRQSKNLVMRAVQGYSRRYKNFADDMSRCGTPCTVMGLDFPNRLGLAAGFDKTGQALSSLAAFGFGHLEVGTVTAHAQPGNPRPRLFRLQKSSALLNRMGFNNPGARRVALTVRKERSQLAALPGQPVIGINIGKTKVVSPAQAPDDYRMCARIVAPWADYVTINVSSPNTPGLRDLQHSEALRRIALAVLEETRQVHQTRSRKGYVPVALKLAPDMSDEQLIDTASLAMELGIDGLILTNTTVNREVLTGEDYAFAQAEAGGISGLPVASRARECLEIVKRLCGDTLAVISVGGIMDASEAALRLSAGADLIQAYTGLIYGGPLWPQRVISGCQ